MVSYERGTPVGFTIQGLGMDSGVETTPLTACKNQFSFKGKTVGIDTLVGLTPIYTHHLGLFCLMM